MKVLLFANTEWYLYNFRRSLALALQAAGHEVLLTSPDGPYGAKLRELGLRWLPLPMERRSLNPLREARLLLRLWRLMRDEQIDVVHGFTIKSAIYGSLAGRLARVKLRISAVAGMGYVFTGRDLRAQLLRPLVRRLFRLALNGDDVRLILQNYDDHLLFRKAHVIDLERIRLIPGSGVDCERFAPVERPPAEPDAPLRVLLPARLVWDKGLAEFVAAARMLQALGAPVEMLLAGAGDEGNPTSVPESTVRGWVAEGVIRRLGHVEDMPALYASVDVVALPSYREGLPKGLVEAAACGLALITTDVPGCRDVVTDGVDGLLIPVRDAQALAEAIVRLQADPALRRRLGTAARAHVLAAFDERLVIDRTLAVYGEVGG